MTEPKWLWLWLSALLLLLLERCRWCGTDACREDERIALLQLKPFFNTPFNDLSSWVEEVKGSDCCQWEGVECNTSSSSPKRVIGLSLDYTRDEYYWESARKVKYSWYLNASLFLPFKELNRLCLRGNLIVGCLENEDFAKLSLALGNLEILDLSENYLNDTILSSLSQLSSLKHLYLAYNSFTGSSHANGFQWLSRLSNLETLDFGGNSLKNSIFFQMGASSSLKSLVLRDNHLKGTVYIHELNNLTNLKNLDLSSNRIENLGPSNQGNETQLRLTNLKVLDLSGNLFRTNTFSFLCGLSSLKSLYMSSNHLQGSINTTELNNMINLKNLDLSNNRIESLRPSNHGNETQLKLTSLEEFVLSGNLFRNNTFSFPRGLSRLKSLFMSSNDLQGSIDITELNNLTNLKKLDLSYNRIESLRLSNQGNETQLKLTSLEELDLSGNLFRNNTFSLPRGLSRLKSLFMSSNDLQGSIDITELNDLINLKTLDLSYNSIESLQSFKDSGRRLNLTHLEGFYLSGNLVDDKVFASINGLSHLKFLDIRFNQLKGSIDMKDLGAFANLEELDLSNNHLTEFVAHKGFKSLRKLKFLGLNGVFTNESTPLLLKLVEAFPSVKTFDLKENYLNTTMATQELHVRSNVEYIFLDHSYLDNNILQSIGVLTSLKTLFLDGCGLTGSLPNQGWCDLRNLEELDISGNALEGILPYCLGNLTSLHVLDISDNQFTGNLTPLANLTSLRYLSLSRNRLQISLPFIPLTNLPNLKILLADENKMVMEPNSFHTSVPNFQLSSISLSNCTTDQKLGQELPKFLYYQYDLRYVDLSYNNFSGTVPFWLLANNTKLEYLFLMGNSLTGPLLLPQLVNPIATSIDISDNKLQGQIPKNICSAFPNLERLVLSKNAIEGNIPSCLSGIIHLDLSNNQLSGRVPEELFARSSLKILRLSNNNLGGEIVPMIFNLSMLSELYLDGNHFVGEIPHIDISSVDFPYSLNDIDLSNNKLHGKLPRWIGNVLSLKRFALSNNQLEGSIPKELCNLHELEFLELSQNNLSSSIPSCFSQTNLRYVHLSGNRLSGQLTHTFYNSSSLVTLDLRGNNLTGNIPEWIDTLSSLSVLLLKANHLNGGIPIQLCKLYLLSIIDLSENMFSGPIPSCLGNLTLATGEEKFVTTDVWYVLYLMKDGSTEIMELRWQDSRFRPYFTDSYMEELVEFTTKNGFYSYSGDILRLMSGIDLSCNMLTGQIPKELGNLSEIHSLNLSHNNLTGVIPSSFSKLKQIESLDLSYNKLSGRIPTQLVELNSLEVFNVAHNNLSGIIPEPKAQFGTFDESCYEGNPFLCGFPLHNNCTKIESPSTIPTRSDDEGEGIFIDTYVFCVTFLVSYVVVLLGTLAVLYINPYWRQAWFSFLESGINNCRYSTVGNFLELYIFKRWA